MLMGQIPNTRVFSSSTICSKQVEHPEIRIYDHDRTFMFLMQMDSGQGRDDLDETLLDSREPGIIQMYIRGKNV